MSTAFDRALMAGAARNGYDLAGKMKANDADFSRKELARLKMEILHEPELPDKVPVFKYLFCGCQMPWDTCFVCAASRQGVASCSAEAQAQARILKAKEEA